MSIFNYGKPSSITILPQTPTPLLDSWRLDATISAAFSHPGSVSRHPVQSGREGITDAVEIGPVTLNVTGVLTDTPITFGPSLAPSDRAARMTDLLDKMRAQRQPLTIVGSWFPRLRNRWVSSYTASKSATTGGSIAISMTIESLEIVRTQLVPQQIDADMQLLGGVGPVTTVGSF